MDARIFNIVYFSRDFSSIIQFANAMSDRTGQGFSWSSSRSAPARTGRSSVRNLVPILTHRVRSTDAVGWFEDGVSASFCRTPRPRAPGSSSPMCEMHSTATLPRSAWCMPTRPRGFPATRRPPAGFPFPQENTRTGGDRRFRIAVFLPSLREPHATDRCPRTVCPVPDPPVEARDRYRRIGSRRRHPPLAAAPVVPILIRDRFARTGALPAGQGRIPRQGVHHLEVPDDARERRCHPPSGLRAGS